MNESKLSVSKGARLGVMLLALLAALAAIQAISAEPAEAASTPRPLTDVSPNI